MVSTISMAPARDIGSTGRDLGLDADDVAVLDRLLFEVAVVAELHAEAAVMELVAHELPVGSVTGQVQLVGEHHEHPLDGHIAGNLHMDPLVPRRVPDFDVHACPRSPGGC